jgi:hypothetical protein
VQIASKEIRRRLFYYKLYSNWNSYRNIFKYEDKSFLKEGEKQSLYSKKMNILRN